MTYRVKELAKRVAPAAGPAEIERIIRRLRHWTASGLLELSSDIHVGPGRHRHYADQAAYTAAVLLALTPYDLPIGTLARVSMAIKLVRVGSPPTLQSAIDGDEELSLAFTPEATSPVLYPSDGHLPLVGPAVIVLNLTMIFAPLRQ